MPRQGPLCLGVLRALLISTSALFLLATGATSAIAHVSLESSRPAAGETLIETPSQVELVFNEPIEAEFAQVRLFGPEGEEIPGGEAVVEADRVRMPIAELTTPGMYQLYYRVIAIDGDPIESMVDFTFAPVVAPEVMADQVAMPSPPPGPPPMPAPDPSLESTVRWLWFARVANYSMLSLVAGLLLTPAWLFADRPMRSRANRRAARAGSTASFLLAGTAAMLFVYGLANAAATPASQVLRFRLLTRFATTRFGSAVLAQFLVALVVCVLARKVRSRDGIRVALLIAALGALAPAFWGHASTSDTGWFAVLSTWAHVLGAASWVGGLACVVLLVLRPCSGNDLGPAQRFSTLAGWALGVVLVTGVLNTLVQLESLEQLLGTPWGRLVILKLVVVAGIALLGWYNRYRSLPLLAWGGVTGRRTFRRMAVVEVGVMLLAFAAASGLASTDPSAEPRPEPTTVATTGVR